MDDLQKQLAQGGALDLMLRIRPRADRTQWRGKRADGVWKIDVAAPPEDGAANMLLRRFVAAEFDLPISQVEIVSGHTSRKKHLRLTALP